jgi:hypothetical protein
LKEDKVNVMQVVNSLYAALANLFPFEHDFERLKPCVVGLHGSLVVLCDVFLQTFLNKNNIKVNYDFLDWIIG